MEAGSTFEGARASYLAVLVAHFGAPESRRVLTGKGAHVEIFKFSAEQIVRYVTFGICMFEGGSVEKKNKELLFVIPSDATEEQQSKSYEYMLDMTAYVLERREPLRVPSVLPYVEFSPWAMRAVLFDEPRGEPEELEIISTPFFDVSLTWVVPLYESEYELISRKGLEALDAHFQEHEVEPVDIDRSDLLSAIAQ